MKYSLRSLMIAVLVLPPLMAWAALPLFRWLTTPKPLNITKPITSPPTVMSRAINDTVSDLPNTSAPAPNPPKN